MLLEARSPVRAGRQRLTRGALTVIAMMAAALALANPAALATPFGPSAGYRYADNSSHSFFRNSGVSSFTWNLILTSRSTDLDPTDMSSSTNTTYNSQVDAWVKETYSPGNPAPAWTSCTNPISSTVCDQFTITFNNAWTYYEAMACHEIGHSIALGHNTSTFDPITCMWGGATLPSSYDHYSSHDVTAHINVQY